MQLISSFKTVIYLGNDDQDDRDLMREALREVTIVEAKNGYDLLTLLTAWSLQGNSSPISVPLVWGTGRVRAQFNSGAHHDGADGCAGAGPVGRTT